MKTADLILALETLGKGYTGKDKTKPADTIVKIVAFLQKRTEDTVDDIVVALNTPKQPKPGKTKVLESSAVSKTYIDQLNKPDLNQNDFEKLLEGIKTLQKAPLAQVARGYSPKSKLDTKEKALTAIREEFVRRTRERDKARKDEHSLLM